MSYTGRTPKARYDPEMHKSAFIRVPKTGSTSITNALIPHKQVNLTSGHIPCRRLLALFPNWRDQFTFAFVRNPWDRLLSYYSPNDNRWDQERWEGVIRSGTPSQVDLICDERGDLLVDFVGRFENIEPDFARVCQTIGIDTPLLPHANASKHDHYTDYYNTCTRKLVASRYAEDIDRFGYTFGEG